ncbi:hypothetical protein CRG98_048180 [Punica granatum]|uniref:Uncharacterized protein n=1 Tax=Punica granatum TaxID=22663 RepID=A0A2I0HI97_PUNGR|nr:hypothetical protein CRG98_048180 [Punica granatum]
MATIVLHVSMQFERQGGGRGQHQNNNRGGKSNRGGGRGSSRFNGSGSWGKQFYGRGNAGRGFNSGARGGPAAITYGRGQPSQLPHSVRSSGNSPSVSDEILGHAPAVVVCQLCNIAGHTAIQCLDYYN